MNVNKININQSELIYNISYTIYESMSIKKEWLEKNAKEALFMGKPYNALVFNFGPNQKNYYIIDEELFEILTNKLEK